MLTTTDFPEISKLILSSDILFIICENMEKGITTDPSFDIFAETKQVTPISRSVEEKILEIENELKAAGLL